MDDEDETRRKNGGTRRTRIDVARRRPRGSATHKKETGREGEGGGIRVRDEEEATSMIPRVRRGRRRTRQRGGGYREGAAYKERRVTRIEP